MSATESDLNDTLALVNAARMAFGQDCITELPDSSPGQAANCLFYRALSGIGVGSVSEKGSMSCKDERQAAYLASVWGTTAHGNTVQAPKQFGRVIHRFDRRELPHYNTAKAPNFEAPEKPHF